MIRSALVGNMTSTPEGRFNGYVLRGGPSNGRVFEGQPVQFVRVPNPDGTEDLYTPSGEPDDEFPDLQRYDLQPVSA